MRYLLSLAFVLLLLLIPAQAATTHFAQVADGGGYTTTITIFNTNSVSVTGTLRFVSQNGSAWRLTINSTTDSQFPVTLPPSGSVRLVTSGIGSSITSGWAILDSTTTLRGVATYEVRSQGVLSETVGVLAGSPVKRFMIPVDVSGTQTNVGVAVANTSSTSPITVKYTLIDETGLVSQVATDPKLTNLAPLGQVAQFLTATFPSLGNTVYKGTLIAEVVGNGSMTATGLSYKTGCPAGCAAAIPVADITDSTVPSTDPKLAREQKLLGDWTFNYTVGVAWADKYHLDAVQPDPTTQGEYMAVGLSDEGTPVKAQYSDTLQAYTLFEAGPIYNESYVFNFTGTNTVSGCYYMQMVADNTISDCYPLTGTRVGSSAPEGMFSRESIQAQKVSAARFSGQCFDPRVIEAIERMKALSAAHDR